MNKSTVRKFIWALAGAFLAVTTVHAANTPQVGDLNRMNLTALQDNTSYDRFIVTYRQGTSERAHSGVAVQTVEAALMRAGLKRSGISTRGMKRVPVNARFMRKLAIGADLIRTSRKLNRVEAEQLARQLSVDPAVAYVTPDVLRRPVRDLRAPATFTPNDTYYGNYQWHLKAPDGGLTAFGHANYGGSNVNNAWDLSDGTGIIIAILDTGITRHVDMDTSLGDAGYDFITDSFVSGRATDGRVPGGWDTGDWTDEEPWLSVCTSPSNPPSGSSWHGTHVASTAGAELTNNALGMAGIAYAAKVLPVRVLGHCGGYDSDINDAIIWAAGGHVDGVPDNANPAQVINLSLGGGGACPPNDPQARAVAEARALGAVVVVSAGNSDTDAANQSPASCPGVITVASTGITSSRAFYSNYGATVEIAAPGGGVFLDDDPATGVIIADGFVWQALNNGDRQPVPLGTTYVGYAGTSQAAPHVSGTVALMQSARLALGDSLLSPSRILADLQRSALTPAVTPDEPIGAGIVDAHAAIETAVNDDVIELTDGRSARNQSGAAGSVTVYAIEVPAGARFLRLTTFGGRGNISMYVKIGDVGGPGDYDYSSTLSRTHQVVSLRSPQAGFYYLTVVGESDYSRVQVRADVIGGGGYVGPRF